MLNKESPIDALAIRDTSDHNSSWVFNGDITVKTLIVENGLNQTCTFQCQGSAHEDFSNVFNIGDSFDVPATTNIFATCDSYIPYWRIIATCATAPTTGTLSVHIFGVGGA